MDAKSHKIFSYLNDWFKRYEDASDEKYMFGLYHFVYTAANIACGGEVDREFEEKILNYIIKSPAKQGPLVCIPKLAKTNFENVRSFVNDSITNLNKFIYYDFDMSVRIFNTFISIAVAITRLLGSDLVTFYNQAVKEITTNDIKDQPSIQPQPRLVRKPNSKVLRRKTTPSSDNNTNDLASLFLKQLGVKNQEENNTVESNDSTPDVEDRKTTSRINNFDDIDSEFNDDSDVNYDSLAKVIRNKCTSLINKLQSGDGDCIDSVGRELIKLAFYLIDELGYEIEDVKKIYEKINKGNK